MKGWLTVKEAAALLGYSERGLWMRIYRKQLPHKKWGRRVLVSIDELDRFWQALPGTSAEEALIKTELK